MLVASWCPFIVVGGKVFTRVINKVGASHTQAECPLEYTRTEQWYQVARAVASVAVAVV